ncbi:MAG: oligosaccharide flippase family protein [Rhodospirillales bacterium]|nr:oligosaccharide flippase family protein [Rhodospirillales bacterium]
MSTDSGDPRGAVDLRRVAGGAATLAVSSAVAQGIGLLSMLALARLYDPAAFGAWAAFMAAASLVGVLGGLRYDIAVVVERDDDDSARLVAVTLLVALAGALVTAAAAGALILWGGGAMSALPRGAVYGLPAVVLASAAIQTAAAWRLRQRRFAYVAASRLGLAALLAAFQIGLAGTGAGGDGLIIGTVFAHVVAAVAFGYPLLAPLRRAASTSGVRDLRAVAARHAAMPGLSAPNSFIGQIFAQGSTVLLVASTPAAFVGRLNLAWRLTYAPLVTVAQSVGQALFPELAAAGSDLRPLRATVLAILRGVALVLAPGVGVLVAFGPAIFAAALGEPWREAGRYAGPVSVAALLMALTTVVERAFDVAGRQRTQLRLNLACNVAALLALVVGLCLAGDGAGIALAWSVAMALQAVTWLLATGIVVGFGAWAASRVAVEAALAALLVPAVAWAARGIVDPLAAVAMALAVYGAGLLWYARASGLLGRAARREAPG